MLQIIQTEFLKCKKCFHYFSESNYPVSLSCNQSLCKNCRQEMLDKNTPCPYDSSHTHTIENTAKNLSLINIMDAILKLIKLNKQNKKYDLDLIKFINELKNNSKKDKLENKDFIYSGALKNNKPLGYGKLIHNKIGIFKGTFYGEFHKGHGEINYIDNNLYKGKWENFKRQEKGSLQFANFDEYNGEFKDDLFHGLGKLFVNKLQEYYEGNWVLGKKEGKFSIYNEDGKFLREENYINDILQSKK